MGTTGPVAIHHLLHACTISRVLDSFRIERRGCRKVPYGVKIDRDQSGAGGMKRGHLIALAIAVVAAVGAWYWASPRYTLYAMRSAAEAGDSDKLASYIDFPALRMAMKEELKAKAAAEMVKPGQQGMGALGAAIAMNMVDGMVDGLVTPATMRKVFVQNKAKGPEGITKVDATSDDLEIERDGLSQFRLYPRGKSADTGLVFSRDGLSWKLTALRMPE